MKPQRLTPPHRGSPYRRLYVPVEISREIPDATEFLPELTEEGLLFRVVSAPPAEPRPRWLTKGVR